MERVVVVVLVLSWLVVAVPVFYLAWTIRRDGSVASRLLRMREDTAGIAAAKVEADAELTAAALAAIAKLGAATIPPPLMDQARKAADELLESAAKTAADKRKEA